MHSFVIYVITYIMNDWNHGQVSVIDGCVSTLDQKAAIGGVREASPSCCIGKNALDGRVIRVRTDRGSTKGRGNKEGPEGLALPSARTATS
jgi:hypothetical protein